MSDRTEQVEAPPDLTFREADLDCTADAEAVVGLLNHYAADPMGQGKELDDDVRGRLIENLQRHPTSLVFVAFSADRPIGLAVCFHGFSTFAGRPLVNVHDFVVHREYRGQGIGSRLMAYVVSRAEQMGCCRLTLEVRADNAVAKSVYRAQGFSSGDPNYEFWAMPLNGD